MKNLKIQENTEQVASVHATPESDTNEAGGCGSYFVFTATEGGSSSSKGKMKPKSQRKGKQVIGASSSVLTSKDVMKMMNLKIQETDEVCGGSSNGKKKPKSQTKRKKVKIATASATRKKIRYYSTTSSSSRSSSSPLVLLRSNEGDIFEVQESVALLSQTITHMIEDVVVAGNVITLFNISSDILKKVIEFLEKHVEKDRDEDEKEELRKWDEKFAEELKTSQYILVEMILAANYLATNCLLDVSCQACADMIKGKTPEWIRKFFNILNDFTPEEEEEEVRRENQWAFE
ncbi:hypothetical protein MKW98_023228 [Papaver atlanticum]|uniref:SKP1-like protein n=1 Tax=Papaver atlanticum TaxID=357466 RepID=A0AAD4TCB5_9MAGN|nr:hypothetical protein MKW98_023228 [Papaver atlanticum]